MLRLKLLSACPRQLARPTPRRLSRGCCFSLTHRHYSASSAASTAAASTSTVNSSVGAPRTDSKPADKTVHHALATTQNLYFVTDTSPGSPVFLPHGTRIFNRLVQFLRAQYAQHGFEEVNTPQIFRNTLWRQSGHYDKYANDMFRVSSLKRAATGGAGGSGEEGMDGEGGVVGDSLKPMNCPGHCLIYAEQKRGWRELPLRLAEFSPLHRDEVRSALTGLTRVRRFHQDDAHIFCRPDQILAEISATLSMLDAVYRIFRLTDYRFVLSTCPRDALGSADEWAHAEQVLVDCLNATQRQWTLNDGDGAFYGPKIDVLLRDDEGREHQTATIQLDFQLPKNFKLRYDAPKTSDTTTKGSDSAAKYDGTPVIVHRALFGSLERFMALLIEKYRGNWPFWLSPRQAIVIPTSDNTDTTAFAARVQATLAGITLDSSSGQRSNAPRPLGARTFHVDVSENWRKRLGRRVAEAKGMGDGKGMGYNVVVVVGEKEARSGSVKFEWYDYRVGGYVSGGDAVTPEQLYARFVEMEGDYE
ncbi:hypothetical protein Dda_2512 [Drechslerella dactyloides]|uniref:threonine--tRNA ligase n=1 Tax=Drechslerella dactyloides TaxID=74499 RepID=A0AAD6NKE5_DREDA|nr:hypothetical protein Dda_2512 [Drechslerella dactyloides]